MNKEIDFNSIIFLQKHNAYVDFAIIKDFLIWITNVRSGTYPKYKESDKSSQTDRHNI